MGWVNDRLPAGAMPTRDLPDRRALAKLGYPERLNAVGELLVAHSERGRGHRPALRSSDGVATYEDVWRRVAQLAASLSDAGIGRGDRIIIHLPNSPELVESWLATLHLGAVAVTTVPALGPHELTVIAAQTSPRCIISHDAFADVLRRATLPDGLRLVVGEKQPSGAAYESYLQHAHPRWQPAPTSADDVALVAYTSGSTGQQKGTIHTHADILAIADCYAAEVLSPTCDDIFFSQAPIGFTYALGALVVFPFRVGASSVLDGRPFHPRSFLARVAESKATLVFLGPTSCRLLMGHAECRDPEVWRSVRAVVSAGEKLSSETHERWHALTGTELLDGCGSTELLHIWVSQRLGASVGGCVGRPVRHFAVRLYDGEGRVVTAEEGEGELAVAGPTGCRYWMNQALQSATVRQGWTLTRDRFRRDAQGRYWHLGRVDDLIISAGNNVSPLEVEEVLLQHPRVEQVAVVGLDDKAGGTVVQAFVVAGALGGGERALSAELRGFVRDRLASFKCPQKITFVAELPRTVTGKLNRVALRLSA